MLALSLALALTIKAEVDTLFVELMGFRWKNKTSTIAICEICGKRYQRADHDGDQVHMARHMLQHPRKP